MRRIPQTTALFCLLLLGAALSAQTVTMSPANNATVTSPVSVNATFSNGGTAQYMKLWVDGAAVFTKAGSNTLTDSVTLSAGTHRLTVQAYNGHLYSAKSKVTVQTTPLPPAPSPTVTISSPGANATVGSPFTVNAAFSNGGAAQYMKLWMDGVALYFNNNLDTLSFSVTAAAGTHQIIVQAYNGTLYSASDNITVQTSSPTPTPTPTPTGLDLYVSTSGSDSNSGSASAPFRTITHAGAVATAGYSVHVAAGTYNENVSTSSNGTSSAHIVYLSDTKWAAKIVSTSDSWTNHGNYVDIKGFDVSGSGYHGILNYGSFVRTIGNHVHDVAKGGCNGSNGGAGIDDANYSASDDDSIGNWVNNIGPGPGACNGIHGIYHSNLRGHVMNNIVSGASAWGIQLWHAANNVVITNNTVFNNGGFVGTGYVGGGMVIGDGDAPGGVTVDNTTVANNIIVHNGGYAIQEYGATGTHNVYLNNLSFANSLPITLQNGLVAQHTVALDPQFVNYQANGSGDYHLTSTSPAIDAGTGTLAPANDFSNGARPFGSNFDIGAYEFSATAGAWPY